MITEEMQKFKEYLRKYTDVFTDEFDSVKAAELKAEIDKEDKNEIIQNWVTFLKNQGPVEKISETKYEIYDVNNFLGDTTESSTDYIHLVQWKDSDKPSAIFMRFYVVFYCLINGIKSNQYSVTG